MEYRRRSRSPISNWRVALAFLLSVHSVLSLSSPSSFTCFMMEGEGTHLSSPSHLLRKSSSPPRRSVRIIVVRHEATTNNKRLIKLREQGMDWENIRQIMLKETDSQSLVDATLTPQGIEQAKASGVNIANKFPAVKYIFTSPLRRTVDTTVNIAKGIFSVTNHLPKIILAPWDPKPNEVK